MIASMRRWTGGVCRANGIEVRFDRTGGGGQPIVLLHGLMGSGACWRPVARAIDRDVDVVLPDARGHGGSTAPASGYSYDELADDVVGFLEALRLERPVLVGHSMGGMTAAVVASRGARTLRGLVLVDLTFIGPDRQQEVWEGDVADQHRRALGSSRSELVAEALARHPHRAREIVELQVEARLSTSPHAFEVLKPPNPDFRSVVRAIDVPTLLVIGDTPVVSLELAGELAGINPLLRVEQIANAGHGLPFDQPEQLERAITSFLRVLP